jgi:hypothetical protein
MTLTAGTSELGGSGTISYQWLRNNTEIGEATSATYTVKELDYGGCQLQEISLQVIKPLRLVPGRRLSSK